MVHKTIKVEFLARVEGEGALHVNIKDSVVEDVRLEIFEPPRFFEAFLQGRAYSEVPDIVARICGICPVAYQMSAVHAMEDAFDVTITDEIRALRRLLYCGEWIESHVLHVYMLHSPDFLGYEGAIEMAKDFPGVVERGLQMKKAGNAILQTLGGREIHPINIRVGGFYKMPSVKDMQVLLEKLQWARDAAIETVRWVAGFDFPEFSRHYEFVALQHPDEYPMNEGRLISNEGLQIDVRDYELHFEERQVSHSTALHSSIKARGHYFSGPMARFNLNHSALSPLTHQLANEIGFSAPCYNPFKSIIIRALEVLHAFDEATQLVQDYKRPDIAAVDCDPKKSIGYACTEAPRGILYHRYELDENGIIVNARIVPPTSQNQPTIEQDLRELVEQNIHLPDVDLQHRCEQSIRNYDPCISCSTHFLKLDVNRA